MIGRREAMNTARNRCIWIDCCISDCPAGCPDYTPADDSLEELFYNRVLGENLEEYQQMVSEYIDDNDWEVEHDDIERGNPILL